MTDKGDLDLTEQVLRRLSMMVAANARYDELRGAEPLPHSQLAEDDRATAWLNLSHQVRSYLNLASDMVRALERLLIVDDTFQLPLHAHYPLLRSIIEASAQALWVLEPESHRERVQRSLRARITEQKWDDDMHAEVVKSGILFGQATAEFLAAGQAKIDERRETLRAKVRELSDNAGLVWGTTASGLPATVTILRNVGKLGDVPGEYAASIWRLISGLTHPSASRATHYSSVEILSEDSNGILSTRISASVDWTHSALLLALTLYASAITKYRVRRTKPHAPEPHAPEDRPAPTRAPEKRHADD
ncbi:hypothetical protein JNB62_13095 [Microbacterium jejuense]|uniref:Uncharacterized protein n=1 Tax=Microbacterium jejuense TaxID=1263637 RepID=A0ABS7HNU9_9MICO|nr:hypothetical protein [Microbacterium jejuense]MBW9094626.1 hypothetical protein [Microbacterium jejuense]